MEGSTLRSSGSRVAGASGSREEAGSLHHQDEAMDHASIVSSDAAAASEIVLNSKLFVVQVALRVRDRDWDCQRWTQMLRERPSRKGLCLKAHALQQCSEATGIKTRMGVEASTARLIAPWDFVTFSLPCYRCGLCMLLNSNFKYCC